ncbi:hypothetical protein IFR05_009555 [Cadophora sp. M221]|nr:hypothetical protein IFR05_009555 [Cadophora sp. M221]
MPNLFMEPQKLEELEREIAIERLGLQTAQAGLEMRRVQLRRAEVHIGDHDNVELHDSQGIVAKGQAQETSLVAQEAQPDEGISNYDVNEDDSDDDNFDEHDFGEYDLDKDDSEEDDLGQHEFLQGYFK